MYYVSSLRGIISPYTTPHALLTTHHSPASETGDESSEGVREW